MSAHAASLNAAVSTKLIKLYTSSTTDHTSLPAPVSTGNIVTPPRTHPSRTETQGETNSFSEEQQQEQQEGTFPRENTPASDVISFGSEEGQVRDTPHSPVQSASPSPVLPLTFPPAQPDDYYILTISSRPQTLWGLTKWLAHVGAICVARSAPTFLQSPDPFCSPQRVENVGAISPSRGPEK